MPRSWRPGTALMMAVPLVVGTTAPPTTTTEAAVAEAKDESFLDGLKSGVKLGHFAREVGTVLVWAGVALVLLYLVAALVLRLFIPLNANSGLKGTLRRAREQLPIVGRAYRPKLNLEVVEADGSGKERAITVRELMLDEMRSAKSGVWFDERFVGDDFTKGIVKALETVHTGLAGVGGFLLSKLPQESFTIRVQLHMLSSAHMSMTAELLGRSKQILNSNVFTVRRPTNDSDGELLGLKLLLCDASAWISFQLYDHWPGEQTTRPNPMNTHDGASFGAFRQGVLLESIGAIPEARAAFHRAIDADPHNVGALLRLAVIDSRDRERIELCRLALRDADHVIDDMNDDAERARLRLSIKEVRAIAALNEIAWRCDGTLSLGAGLNYLAQATEAISVLARTVLATPVTSPERSKQLRRVEETVLALAAALAVEDEILSPHPTVDLFDRTRVEALQQLAGARRLGFSQCVQLLHRPGEPTRTITTYSLACAHARRATGTSNDEQRKHEVEQACVLLREALAGDPALAAWALPKRRTPSKRSPYISQPEDLFDRDASFDPTLVALWREPQFERIMGEFCSPPLTK